MPSPHKIEPVKHRRRGLAFKSFKETIENVVEEHEARKIEVYCWPTSLASRKLFESLRKYFEAQHIPVKIIT